MNFFSLLGLSLCCFLAPTVHAGAAEDEFITYSADELRNMITLRGREFQDAGDIVMDWSGSGFEFTIEGSLVVEASFDSPSGKIAVVVDDGEPQRIFIRGAAKTTLATGLSLGKAHTIKVYKDNEAGGALCALTSLTVEEGAKIGKTKAKTHRFDFVGDSITCGNQIDHDKNISAYGAFPRVLSDMYDADYHCVSVSGRGLMEGYNSEVGWGARQTDELKDLYFTSSFFRDKNKPYDLSRYEPEVIFANVGNNDLGRDIMNLFGTTIDSYLEEVGKFHQKLRAAYPNAYILFTYGAYQNRWYEQEYREYVEALDERTGFEYLPFYSDGADNHPSYHQHQLFATRIANHLYEKAGLKPVTDLRYKEHRFEAEKCERFGFDTNPINADENINCSDWHYVMNMGSKMPISNPKDISLTGENVKVLYQEIEINAEEEGEFEFTVGYQNPGTEKEAYLCIDEEEWVKFSLPMTGSGVTYESPRVKIHLSKGYYDLYVTGPTSVTNDVRYDYISLEPLTPRLKGETPAPEEKPPESEKPNAVLPVILGASFGAGVLLFAAAGFFLFRKKKA